jgi:ubiquinone/menaquinone biosynthesis C-methylase UbiE
MDAHSLNFKDSSFDIIVCYKSMFYIDLNKAFVELKRLLRPNGKIIILENISDNFIFHYYRYLKHILNNKNYSKEINKLKIKDLNLASKFFDYHEIVYFDFFTYFGKIIKDKFKIKISYNFLKFLDNFFLNNLKLKSLSFTAIFVLKKK